MTLDAMGCQRALAKQIVEQGGDYLFTLKNNQKGLREALIERFETTPMREMTTVSSVEKGHGRIEERTLHLCRALDGIDAVDKWVGLSYVARIVRTRITKKKGVEHTSTQTSYLIGSNKTATAPDIALLIRNHWAIENQVHWNLDQSFGEDGAAHRARAGAANMAIMRRFALNILRADTTRTHGVANARRHALISPKYVVQLMTAPLACSPFGNIIPTAA